jgi:MFS family permease
MFVSPFAKVRGTFYGWWLVAIGGLLMVITVVPVFQTTAVWAVALEYQFGWSRTQLGLALSFTRIEGSLTGPIAGYMVDRFGTRFMVFTGLLILSGGMFLFSQVQNLWMFYLAYFVMSIGQGQGGWLPVMTMLNHWFNRRRGTAMGIAMTIMGVGGLILVPVVAWQINPEESGRLGWRWTLFILALVSLAFAFVLPKFIRNRPEDYGDYPDGKQPLAQPEPSPQTDPAIGPKDGGPDDGEIGLTVAEALRTQAFWCISVGHGLGSMVVLGIMAHLGLMMQDVGFGLQTAAWILTIQSAVSIVFQFLGGYLGDRVPKNLALFVFTTLQGVGVILLTLGDQIIYFYAFAVVFGIGFGGRTPLTTAIRGDYFGRASFGKILGVSMVPMNVLLLIAAPMAGFMRDELGDYDLAFLTLGGLSILGAVLFLIARRPKLPVRAPAAAVAYK